MSGLGASETRARLCGTGFYRPLYLLRLSEAAPFGSNSLTHTLSLAHSLSLTHSLSVSLALSNSLSLSRSLARSRSLILSLSFTQTHTHACTHAHTRVHTHTQTHTHTHTHTTHKHTNQASTCVAYAAARHTQSQSSRAIQPLPKELFFSLRVPRPEAHARSHKQTHAVKCDIRRYAPY